MDMMKLLKQISKKQKDSRKWTRLVQLSGVLVGCYEHGNEQLGLQNESNFLTS